MDLERYSRQLALIDPREMPPVTIIGAGHLGSNVARTLAEMGCPKLTIYDVDEVESANVAASLYGPSDIGKPKVEALRDKIKLLVGDEIEIVIKNEKYVDQDLEDQVVYITVDTLKGRRQIWEALKVKAPNLKFIVDMRSGKDIVSCYAFTPETADKEFLPSLDRTPVHLACSEKAVAFNASTISGIAASLLRNFIRGHKVPNRIVLDHRSWGIQIT